MKGVPIIYIVGLILLGGCERKPVDLSVVRSNVELHVHFLPPTTLSAQARDLGLIGKERGFAVWSPNDNRCDVYQEKPKHLDDDKTLTLGHEVLHCLSGQFHK